MRFLTFPFYDPGNIIPTDNACVRTFALEAGLK